MIHDHQPEQNAPDDICAVCGWKARECRESFSHLRHNAKMISICSPQCMEQFQREPDRFAAAAREATGSFPDGMHSFDMDTAANGLKSDATT